MSNSSYYLQFLTVYLGLQVFAAVLSSGPTRHRLNASYKTADSSSFQVTFLSNFVICYEPYFENIILFLHRMNLELH